MESSYSTSKAPHRRYNPLLKSWILVSPQRLNRPWTGQVEKPEEKAKVIDDNNPLKPNVTRGSGKKNPDYKSIYVFDNDFPALLKEIPKDDKTDTNDKEYNFFKSQNIKGDCKVMCFHPNSHVTLATMTNVEVQNVIKHWGKIINELKNDFEWIQIFENRGEMMGCSNPHPHCQIWSTNYLPNIPAKKQESLKEYFHKYKSPMLYDYVHKEIKSKERIVITNQDWACVVPFWAEWPFETMIIPLRKDVQRFTDLKQSEIENLASIMQTLLNKYNGLFKCEFPYSMGWHGAPTGQYLKENTQHWTLHAIYYPPLLRSATIKKFFVGFELLSESQRDLTAEKAAEILKNI